MKKLLIPVLKALVLILLFTAAAVGCYALASFMQWPWWAGACLFGGIIGIIAVALFTRRWYFRRREKRFVQRIVDRDATAIDAAPDKERGRLLDLQTRWLEAVEILRNSKLRNRGNPLYVLPWYMILGETDSGKTTAVAGSGLTSILTDAGPVPGVSSTRNCDWWFFEEAIILDTAGRYAVSLDESRDRNEWKQFLTLLARYRKKEPLNGLIVTVPADRLLENDAELTGYGQGLRRRTDELMRVLGAKFPVYILVTKLDLVFGMNGLTELLPTPMHSRAMGSINDHPGSSPEDFVNRALAGLTGKLRELRLTLIEGSTHFDPAFLLFSDEIQRLEPGLQAFAAGLFEENPYQESPLFRGLFLSSGRQTDDLSPRFFESLPSLQKIGNRQPEQSRGLFLHDFFSRVLPEDRNLFTPIFEYLRWKLVMRNLGFTAWFLLLFFVCGLLSLSYRGNLRTITAVTNTFPARPEFSAEIEDRIIEMTSFRIRLEKVRSLNRNWKIPRMGLNTGLDAEKRMTDFYCTRFSTHLLLPMDRHIDNALKRLHSETPGRITSEYARQLVWRIDLLENRRHGDTAPAPRLPSGSGLARAVPGFTPDLMNYFGKLYESYIAWSGDEEALQEQLLSSKARLGRVLALKSADFRWLVDWADDTPHLHRVTLRDFWGGPPLTSKDEFSISPAFTQPGRAVLADFLGDLKNAMPDDSRFHEQEKAFWKWYANRYFSEWLTFAERFMHGEGQLLTSGDSRDMAARMATDDNPCFNLLHRMQQEFAPLKDMTRVPAWVRQVFDFNVIMAQHRAGRAKGVDEATEAAQESLRRIIVDVGGRSVKSMEKHIQSAGKLEIYLKALGEVAHYADNREDAFKSAAALFPPAGSGPASSDLAGNAKNPVDTADHAIGSLKGLMGTRGQGQSAFWNLVSGPLDFIVSVITQEASCELQGLWEEQVLARVVHVPERKLRKTLFGKSGIVDAFTAGPARPFLTRDARGFKGRSRYGIPFPFRNSFYAFLDDGARGAQEIQSEYRVKLRTIPTTVNTEATEDPYSTLLEVNCGAAPQSLDNYNFAEEQTFTWKPDTCGTTRLTIQLPGMRLSRTYEGKLGFARFLKDFRSGSKVFTPEDFPEQIRKLKGFGITSIKVAYEISGAEPLIDILDIRPVTVPDTITKCRRH